MSTSRARRRAAPRRPRIALTSGEPAGIGPELCAQVAAMRDFDCDLVCLGDRSLLAGRADAAHVSLDIVEAGAAAPGVAPRAGRNRPRLQVEHHALPVASEPGRLDPANSAYVIGLLDAALAGIEAGRFDAMVTAPVHKGIINDSGRPFTGHTEYLAERTGAARPVMLLVAERLRVALATTHLPLREVPAAITGEALDATLRVLDADLRRLWGIPRPRIAVLGLNPHAGESGHLGDEELQVIAPAIARARAGGIDAFGPLPADTAFVPRELARCDAVLAMYHDQGLPVLKYSGFEQAVNISLGLPFVRVAVDHGTALPLAGTGQADPSSLIAAHRLACSLALHRRNAPP
jgi:4-hydroxythreonine-4-phosphate dehydrogenase